MKVEKKKISALSGFTEVHFMFTARNEKEHKELFAVVANQMGIRFEGKSPTIEDMDDLNILAKTIGEAWNEHITLTPKLTRTFSGH